MTVRYIAGSFRIVGSSPDGDSIRFTPNDPDAFTKAGIDVEMNEAGSVQLRLDAIDALETHYTPPTGGPQWRQPAALGAGASAVLLDLLGFTHVDRDEHGAVSATIPDVTYGYILTQFADKYGRAVAMVFAGERAEGGLDGSEVYLGVAELLYSVNYQLLAAGWVYPTFYSRLFVDLRDALAASAVAARSSATGVWADDVTLAGFDLVGRDELVQDFVMLPKLFRRLVEFLASDPTGGVDLSGFAPFLTAKGDQLYLLPADELTTLDTIIEVDRQHVRMTIPPEQVVFVEA